MTAARHGVSLTSRGQLVVSGEGFQIALQLTTEELRSMSDMLTEVADRLEDEAADVATAALNRAAGRLQ